MTMARKLVAEVALTGDRRATLEAMRDRLAEAMDSAPDSVVAQVSARLQAVLLELDDLSNGRKVSSVDELASRRQDRFTAADIPEPARRPSRERGRRSG